MAKPSSNPLYTFISGMIVLVLIVAGIFWIVNPTKIKEDILKIYHTPDTTITIHNGVPDTVITIRK